MKKTQKTNKRIIALILAIITIFSVFAMTAASAYAATQESYPISSYPNGSYYTTTKKDCTSSHKSCITYHSSSQCMAFAKYATDQYAHRSSFSYIAGDTDETVKKFNSNTSTAKTVMKSIPVGAYVRVVGNSGYSSHSFVLISVSDTEVKMYDANFVGYCQVGTHTLSFSDFIKRYSSVSVVMSHKFTKTPVSFDKTYHKVACSSSGCTGYKLVAHIAKTGSDGVTKCSACGYIISIKGAEVASIGDEVASAGNEMVSANNEIASVDNETAPVGDEIATADEETTVGDEEITDVNDETTAADEETTVAGEETTDTIEETTVADEDTATTYNIAN